MNDAQATIKAQSQDLEFTTFRVGDLLIGVDIQHVQEINRHVEVTPVPHSPGCVRGVINLRGDVVTVLELRAILGLPPAALTSASRNVIVNAGSEKVGLLVDNVADVVATSAEGIESPPANVSGVAGRFFTGVCKLEGQLLVVLDINEVLAADNDDQNG